MQEPIAVIFLRHFIFSEIFAGNRFEKLSFHASPYPEVRYDNMSSIFYNVDYYQGPLIEKEIKIDFNYTRLVS